MGIGPRRRTNPVENLNAYVMVHGGVDRHERLLDVEWIRDVVKAAQAVADLAHLRDANDQQFHDNIDRLKEVLRKA